MVSTKRVLLKKYASLKVKSSRRNSTRMFHKQDSLSIDTKDSGAITEISWMTLVSSIQTTNSSALASLLVLCPEELRNNTCFAMCLGLIIPSFYNQLLGLTTEEVISKKLHAAISEYISDICNNID